MLKKAKSGSELGKTHRGSNSFHMDDQMIAMAGLRNFPKCLGDIDGRKILSPKNVKLEPQ
jgi:hypothetical protein